jgi:hypothetical protein
MESKFQLPIRTYPELNLQTGVVTQKSRLEKWKKAYNSEIYALPTEEEQYYITLLKNVMPFALPFHLQVVDHIPKAYGDYDHTTCLIRIARRCRKMAFNEVAMLDTAIHELCHHIDYYHLSINPRGFSHSNKFHVAIEVLTVKHYLITGNYNKTNYPPIETLRKAAGDDSLPVNTLYSRWRYCELDNLYTPKNHNWTVKELCEQLGVDLINGKVLDRPSQAKAC